VTILAHTANRVAEVRPQGAELDAAQFASAIAVPYSTVARWLPAWLALGVEGVRVVPSRGRGGRAYRVCATLPQRWLACELPDPCARRAA